MRVLLGVLLLLPGCAERRSFDERYADTQKNLIERTQKLDAAADPANHSAPGSSNTN
jgi:hypothetical protein